MLLPWTSFSPSYSVGNLTHRSSNLGVMSSELAGAGARRGWKLLRGAVAEQKKAVAAGVVVGLTWTAAKVAVPSLASRAIDQGIIKNEHNALLKWGVIMLVVGLVQAISTGLRRWFAFGVAWRAEANLRHRLFAHLQRLHFAFHDTTQTGQLMSRAATDLQQIQSFLVMIPITMANFMTVALITVVLLSMNVKLALLALAALPLLNVAAKRFSSRIHPVSMSLQQELASLATVVEETITGIRAVKGFGAEPIQAARMHERTSMVYERSMLMARIRATFAPMMDFLPAIGLVLVLWYGGHQVISGHLTIGELVAFTAYVNMLIWPLRSLGMIIAQGQRAVAGAERIDEVLAEEPAVANRPSA